MFKQCIIFLTVMIAHFVPMFSMQDNFDRIVQAAKTGDLATIQALDPDGTNPAITIAGPNFGWTPLNLAAVNDQLALVDYYVKKLESQGKDINPALTAAGSTLSWTPLFGAAFKGYLAIVNYYVKKLESQGKDINPALTNGQDLGWTPLHAAAIAGHIDIVKTLIYRGALITGRNNIGRTAEGVARAVNKQDVADYLYMTAPLTQQLLRECSGSTMNLIAALAEIHRKLFKTQNKTRTGRCLAEALASDWDRSLHHIEQLIRQGAEVNVQGKKGYSPLHCLIGQYNPEGPTQFDEAVRILIDSGKVNLDAVPIMEILH